MQSSRAPPAFAPVDSWAVLLDGLWLPLSIPIFFFMLVFYGGRMRRRMLKRQDAYLDKQLAATERIAASEQGYASLIDEQNRFARERDEAGLELSRELLAAHQASARNLADINAPLKAVLEAAVSNTGKHRR